MSKLDKQNKEVVLIAGSSGQSPRPGQQASYAAAVGGESCWGLPPHHPLHPPNTRTLNIK